MRPCLISTYRRRSNLTSRSYEDGHSGFTFGGHGMLGELRQVTTGLLKPNKRMYYRTACLHAPHSWTIVLYNSTDCRVRTIHDIINPSCANKFIMSQRILTRLVGNTVVRMIKMLTTCESFRALHAPKYFQAARLPWLVRSTDAAVTLQSDMTVPTKRVQFEESVSDTYLLHYLVRSFNNTRRF